MQLFFTDPWWLALTIPALLVPLLLRRRVRVWQAAALAALTLAAAGPVIRLADGKPEVLVLCDDSPGAAEQGAAKAAELRREHNRLRRIDNSGGPARTLAEAGASIRADGGGTIHLFSDFQREGGSVAKEARALAARGIPVFPHPVDAVPSPGVTLTGLKYPMVAGAGENTEAEVELSASRSTPLELILRDRNGATVAKKALTAIPGKQLAALRFALRTPGEHDLTLELNGQRAATLRLRVEEPYRALLISARPKEELPALTRLLAGSATVEAYRAGTNPADYPLLVLGEGAVETLSPETLAKIAGAVEQGAGMLVFPGRGIPFAPGGVPAEFERLFPVRYTGKNLDRIPTASLVVIIDTSGSMSGTRIALAREVARLALDKLRDCDMAGIVEFHGRRRWAAPLQSATNHLELRRALNRLNAGGGTIILPAVREAFYTLRNADTRLKHVLIITDGGVEQGDFESLLRQMARNDITVSTVMVGPGRSDFLARLALWGNGRFYTAASRFSLPELTFRQSGKDVLPPFREGNFTLERRGSSSPLLSELQGQLAVGGVLDNELKPGSEELIRTGGQPLVAFRANGLGAAATVNTELAGEWVRELNSNAAYAGMLAATARNLPDPVRLRRFAFRNDSLHRDAHIRIDTLAPLRELFAELLPPGGKPERFRLGAEADGAFHFRRADLPPGVYTLKVAPTPDFTAGAETVRFEPGPTPGPSGLELAAEIGRRSQLLPPPAAAPEYFRLRAFFGSAFLVLLLLQILLRRLPPRGTAALAAVLFVCFAGLPAANGGEYESRMREGLQGKTPVEAFRQAANSAKNPADRRFALTLQLETARAEGQLDALLNEWSAAPGSDPERLALLVNELEDGGRAEEALKLLERYAGDGDTRFAPQLIRLAEKSGRAEAIRNEVREKAAREPERLFRLHAAFRLELSAGRREEAARLLSSRIASETDPDRLAAIAGMAEEAALYPEAEAAIAKLETLPGGDPWQARFRRLDLLRRRGKPEEAVAQLRRLAGEQEIAPGVLMNAADRAEQLGDTDTALTLYRRAGSEDARIRTAMLLEATGKTAEASALWQEIRRTADNEMRARQAMERLIAIAADEKKLDALCEQARAEEAKNPTPRTRLFYCRALAAAGKPDELLRRLATAEAAGEEGAEQMRLDFLLELRRYEEAVPLLEKRKEKHPKDRERILQQLTVIAIETGNRELAERAVGELRETATDRGAALEFSAGVFSLLGDFTRAAELYDECLKLTPDRIELYLLRANAKKAAGNGANEQAFFLSRLDDSVPPDLFGVMVDGLLNLEAPPSMLRTAQAAVMRRIEADPEQLFYYRLGEDLAEELGDQALWRNLQRLQLAVAPERRTLLLGGLFENALQRDARKEALLYARLLLGWNEIYTPELYRSLTLCLTDNGGFSAAERCVRSADAAETGTQYLFDFSRVCMEAGRPEDAARICRELLSLTPDSPELSARYAAVLEMQGKYREAGEENLKALKLLASRLSGEGSGNGKGSNAANFSREIRPLLLSFANQAVLFPDLFKKELAKLSAQARPAARKLVWEPAAERIAALETLPPVSEKKRPPRTTRAGAPSATDFAAMLAQLPPETAAEKVKTQFKGLTPELRANYWPRLIGELSFEPAAPLAAALREELKQLKLRDLYISSTVTPFALDLKRRYAEALLKQYPDSLHSLTLAARMRWQTGDPAGARFLAGEAYDRFLNDEDPKLPAARRLDDLNLVYAVAGGEDETAGAQARDEWIASTEEDRKLLGDTVPRALLLASLYEGAGRYDEAAECLYRIWKAGGRTLPVFRKMEELTEKTGRVGEFLAVLDGNEPKDPTIRILYSRRLVQLLRNAGREREIRPFLALLPPLLQKREQLRINRALMTPEEFAAGLKQYLTEQSRAGSFLGFFEDDFGTGGLRKYTDRERLRENLLPSLAAESPQLRETLEYLLRGVPVTDRGFQTLFETWRKLPSGNGSAVLSGTQTVPALLALKAATGTEKPDAEERALISELIRHPEVPVETAAVFLEFLPEEERAAGAEALAGRMLAGRLYARQLDLLERLLQQLPAEGRSRAGKLLAATEESSASDETKPARLRLIRLYAPELYAEAREKMAGNAPPPVNSELYLLFGKEPVELRFRNYYAATAEYPDWKTLLALVEPEERTRFTGAAEAGLEEAFRRRLLTGDTLVRHYALLADADPDRRAHWLELAARHDNAADESTLWLADALGDGPERETLLKKLHSGGRFLPLHDKENSQPQPR